MAADAQADPRMKPYIEPALQQLVSALSQMNLEHGSPRKRKLLTVNVHGPSGSSTLSLTSSDSSICGDATIQFSSDLIAVALHCLGLSAFTENFAREDLNDAQDFRALLKSTDAQLEKTLQKTIPNGKRLRFEQWVQESNHKAREEGRNLDLCAFEQFLYEGLQILADDGGPDISQMPFTVIKLEKASFKIRLRDPDNTLPSDAAARKALRETFEHGLRNMLGTRVTNVEWHVNVLESG